MRRLAVLLCTLTILTSPAYADVERPVWRRGVDGLGVAAAGFVLFIGGSLVGLVTTGPLAARANESCPPQLDEPDPERPVADCYDQNYYLLGALVAGMAASALAPWVYDEITDGRGNLGITYAVMGVGAGLAVAGLAADSDALLGGGGLLLLGGPILAYAIFDDDSVQPSVGWRPDGEGGNHLVLGLSGTF